MEPEEPHKHWSRLTRAHEPLTAEEFFTYDVSVDGQRFLFNENAEQKNAPPVDIILNWASSLKK